MVTMNSVSGDSESCESSSSGPAEEKNFIDKILGEMKSQFNKTERKSVNEDSTIDDIPIETPTETETTDSSPPEAIEDKPEDSTNGGEVPEATPNEDTDTTKPRIVLLFKKPNNNDTPQKSKPDNRRSLRHKQNHMEEKLDESMLKRSARRRSKDYNESVLQSAIARKEKSYNEASKPQRLTRQLKPTPKILENLAIAKQEKNKTEKAKPIGKMAKNDSDIETDSKNEDGEKYKKHKHKHNKHSKKTKRFKSNHYPDSDNKDSDSDQSVDDVKIKNKLEEMGHRRSRRISTSRLKDDSNTDIDEQNSTECLMNEESNISNNAELSTVAVELIASRLCLCTQKTQYYLAVNDEEVTYCGAVDSVGDKIVGCSRTVEAKNAMMLRASTRVPYTVMCEAHKNRLLRHNCCPTCGVFCTQGRFVECRAKHQYHRDCQMSVGNVECCPHCASSAPDYDVDIAIHAAKKPIFLPVQKVKHVTAKMTFQTNCNKIEDDIKCVTPPLLPNGTLELLNNCYKNEDYDIDDLIAAVKSDDVDKIAAILGSKSVDSTARLPECHDGTILHFAAQNGTVSTVHVLLISGLQPDVFDKDQNTPLMLAILAEKNEIVQYLIKIGASINIKGTDGMTALHLAAKCGNLKACELLLNSSNGVRDFVNSCDDGGWTPLVWACEHGFANIANYLIKKGADASVRDVEHNVALHWAAFSGSSHIAELLLNKGCDVNAVNAHGDTPLHIGARQDRYNCIIVLLARGADVTLLNKNSESPLDCVPLNGDCYGPISLNITLQASLDYECQNVILTNDISKGKENNPIQCFNNVDMESKPTNFTYITKNCVTSDDVRIDVKISTVQSCNCEDRCVEDDCLCGKLSVQCWYDEEGKLISDFNFNDIPMIFECNDGCSCNVITCNNRVVQKGLTQRFELFKTVDKGWGIRTLRLIQKGSFVCEYVGEIITDAEADRREDDSFLFDLENRVCKSDSDVYCIDAKYYGNFARFINHSCNPNLTSVKVFVEHQDLQFPRIAFFANRDILSDEELSFDYGEKFWMAKYKSFSCLCGSPDCKYSEDVIESTMQNYQRRLEESA